APAPVGAEAALAVAAAATRLPARLQRARVGRRAGPVARVRLRPALVAVAAAATPRGAEEQRAQRDRGRARHPATLPLVIEKDDLDAVVLGATGRALVVEARIVGAQAAGHQAAGLDALRRQRRVDRLRARRGDRQQFGRLPAVVGVADDLDRVGRVLLDELGDGVDEGVVS